MWTFPLTITTRPKPAPVRVYIVPRATSKAARELKAKQDKTTAELRAFVERKAAIERAARGRGQ